MEIGLEDARACLMTFAQKHICCFWDLTVQLILDILKQPKIDENHPTWLHLQIREFDPTFDGKKLRSHRVNATNHEQDGKWTIGFTNAKACDAARLLILEETNKQRSSVESLLAPLLNISQHIANCQGD